MHHDLSEQWFTSSADPFATCPVTQGALLRAWLRAGASTADATGVLGALTSSERHQFWPDDQPFSDVDLRGVVGHRQVTDAYLAALARSRGGQLLTLDRALAALHPDVAVVMPG